MDSFILIEISNLVIKS